MLTAGQFAPFGSFLAEHKKMNKNPKTTEKNGSMKIAPLFLKGRPQIWVVGWTDPLGGRSRNLRTGKMSERSRWRTATTTSRKRGVGVPPEGSKNVPEASQVGFTSTIPSHDDSKQYPKYDL